MLHTCKKQGSPSNKFVKGDMGIKRDIEVEKGASQPRDQISAHGQQEDGEGERHGSGRTPCDGYPITHDHPESTVFPLHCVVCDYKNKI